MALVRHEISIGILVGGRGLRMKGRDKARLPVASTGHARGRSPSQQAHTAPPTTTTFVERLVEVLAPHANAVRLAGRSDQRFPELPQCELVPDLRRDCGPMGGVAALLEGAPTPWCFVVACDLPLLEPDVLLMLAHSVLENDRIVVPTSGGRLEPTCALYHRSLAPAFAAAIDAGHLSLQRFVRQRPHRPVTLPPQLQRSLRNFNRPEDLAADPPAYTKAPPR